MLAIPRELLLDGALNVASAFLLLLAGLWLAIQGRPETGARAFAAFLVAWGCAILLANVLPWTGSPMAAALYIGATLVAPLFLGAFAAHVAPDARSARALVWVPVAFGALGVVLFALDPSFFLDVGRAPGVAEYRPATTAGGLWFGVLPFYLMIGIAALAFCDASARAPEPRAARRLALVAAGLLCFLTAAATWFGLRLALSWSSYLETRGVAEAVASCAVYGSAVLLAALAAWRAARDPRLHEARAILLVSAIAPPVTSLGAALVFALGGPLVSPVGPWRIAMVALVLLAILRHRLLDGAIRLQRAAVATLTLFVGIASALVAEGLARAMGGGASALTSTPAAFAVGVAFAAGIVVPYLPASRRAARLALRALVEPHDPSRAQHLEIYRAALEARAERGESLARDEADLAHLRSELDVDARDHDVLALFADRRKGAPVPVLEPGARILDGTLEVRREIARTPSSRVYECEDAGGRRSAVKVFAPLLRGEAAAGARAIEEARILERLRSPHVLGVVQVADRPEGFYLVTERADGTLAARLAEGPLAIDEALRVAREVLEGLAAAHRAGLVHGDLKPENVLLDASGRAVLADFDASVARGAPSRRGTPAWMAPERFAADARMEPSSDVYALGALVVRMVAGRHYLDVDGLGLAEMRLLVERARPENIMDEPPGLATFVARCLEKDPARRPRDADEALRALAALTDGKAGGSSRRR